jgi:pimeloyl-ACP methyl ester carboxylesterase
MSEPQKNVKTSERNRGSFGALHDATGRQISSFDGSLIHTKTVGHGRPEIVCCNGLGVGSFFWMYLERALRTHHQFTTWDYRGHGRSELKKNPRNYNLDALVSDLKAVLDRPTDARTERKNNHKAGSHSSNQTNRPVLVGHSLGVQVILEFYRRWPERVGGMVLCFGTYGRPMDHFYNTKLSRYFFKAIYEVALAFPRESNFVTRLLLKNPLAFFMGGLLKIMHTGMINRQDMDNYINHLLTVDPVFFQMLLKSAQEHSAEPVLRSIQVPTLIIAGELDHFTPVWISKKMHRMIPNSELLVMHKASHAGLVEQPDLVNLRIEKFLRERVKPFLQRAAKNLSPQKSKISKTRKNNKLRLVASA